MLTRIWSRVGYSPHPVKYWRPTSIAVPPRTCTIPKRNVPSEFELVVFYEKCSIFKGGSHGVMFLCVGTRNSLYVNIQIE